MGELRRKKAVFSICGTQRDAQGEMGKMEMVTQGEVVFDDDGSCTLIYEESEMSGMEGVSTRLHLEKDAVTLSRDGEYGAAMRFENGRAFVSRYETPYGALDLSIVSKRVYHRVDEQDGRVRLGYLLTLGGNESYENTLRVDVRYPQNI